jgi:FkbM family methyltransferase
MNSLHLLTFLLRHPLTTRHKFKALTRFLRWQIVCRLSPGSVVVPFVNDVRILVQAGMTGATGNIYAGLHEFEDMSFVLHMLRKEDVFVDIGANIGSYTLLAGGAVGAQVIAIEPIPKTFSHLADNINLNMLHSKVAALNIGLGSKEEVLHFTSDLDTTNHVVADSGAYRDSINVQVKTLDDILSDAVPIMIKIDVEGFEESVLLGGHKVLSNHSLLAVLLELNGAGSRYGTDDDMLHEKMQSYGFEPYRYSPLDRKLFSLNGSHNTLGNTLYIRDINAVMNRVSQCPKYFIQNVRTWL